MSMVYVVIVNYQNWQDTLDCLQSLFCSSYNNFKVFVVDNASVNDSMEQLTRGMNSFKNGSPKPKSTQLTAIDFDNLHCIEELPELVFIQHKKNDGFAAGNNAVLEKLKEETGYVWLLNPDMTVEKDAMGALV